MNTIMKIDRNKGLDWLRGLMALSIMVYHLQKFLFSDPGSQSLVGRLGIYGVSIFFILSGLSMALVYKRFICSLRSSNFFLVRRLFRIVPLMCLAIALQLVLNILRLGDDGQLRASLPAIVSLINKNIPVGSWSIFDELIFYLLTPAIIMIYNRSTRIGNGITLITILIGFIYSILMLNPNTTLIAQWGVYINPINHFFFYTTGIAIYYNFHEKSIGQASNIILFLVCFGLFAALPYSGNQIAIVAGFHRVIFYLLCSCIVFSFYQFTLPLPNFLQKPLELFGLSTYSVYMFHVIVLRYLLLIFKGDAVLSKMTIFFLTILLTVPLSLLSYYFFESPFIRLGKKITSIKSTHILKIDAP
jgi:exopolysaccharide production protein ExoZ